MKHGEETGRRRARHKPHLAFTLVELLVVVAVIGVLAFLGLPLLARRHAKSSKIACVNNLKQLGLAFRVFSTDHGDRYPMQVYRDITLLPPPATRPAYFYSVMSNELSTPSVLRCPHDDRLRATDWSTLGTSNLSYFIGVAASETEPQMWLAGDRNLQTNGVPVGPGLLRLDTNMSVGWTAAMHNRCGNVVLGDGSVQQTTSPRLQAMAAGQAAATNDLLVP